MFLWDTCVVSEIGKSDQREDVLDKLRVQPTEETFVSAKTVGEIETGLRMLPIGKRRTQLERVMRAVIVEFGPRVLPVDGSLATTWAELEARMRLSGMKKPAADMLIAATALHHGLTLVTRNVRDFEATGVDIYNPWDADDRPA